MAFARGIVAAVPAMLFAVVGQLEPSWRKRRVEALKHFGCDRTGFLGVHGALYRGAEIQGPAMQITITKGERGDRIDASARRRQPRHYDLSAQGPDSARRRSLFRGVPNSACTADSGGLSLRAAPEQVQEIAKAGGHASASRGREPDPGIVETIQAERAVERFEADLWGGSSSDPDTFREAINAGCCPVIGSRASSLAIRRSRLFAASSWICGARWSALPQGQSITLRLGRSRRHEAHAFSHGRVEGAQARCAVPRLRRAGRVQGATAAGRLRRAGRLALPVPRPCPRA